VTVRAQLVRVLETQKTVTGGLGGHEFLGGVAMVVEYEITTPSGLLIVIPSPSANAQDPGISGVVDILEWGGWVSCKALRVIQFGLETFGIAAVTQSDKPCNSPRVCGEFEPIGVTTWTPFDTIDQTTGQTWPPSTFSRVWPNPPLSWETFSSSGLTATIEGEYVASCADDPPGGGRAGLAGFG